MKISSLVHRNVTSCTTHDNLDRAAQLMWDHDIGCLPVIDEQGHVAGIVTDRDICMAAYTRGTPLRGIPVASVMTRQVFSCKESDDVSDIERSMGKHQIHRMPVIDDQGHPTGMVSLNDIARAATAGQLPPREVASTLAAVSAPRPAVSTSV
jgi:CBS domain-containing protein